MISCRLQHLLFFAMILHRYILLIVRAKEVFLLPKNNKIIEWMELVAIIYDILALYMHNFIEWCIIV
jgi:hypothetical protein